MITMQDFEYEDLIANLNFYKKRCASYYTKINELKRDVQSKDFRIGELKIRLRNLRDETCHEIELKSERIAYQKKLEAKIRRQKEALKTLNDTIELMKQRTERTCNYCAEKINRDCSDICSWCSRNPIYSDCYEPKVVD